MFINALYVDSQDAYVLVSIGARINANNVLSIPHTGDFTLKHGQLPFCWRVTISEESHPVFEESNDTLYSAGEAYVIANLNRR